jgi:hypothetical protein
MAFLELRRSPLLSIGLIVALAACRDQRAPTQGPPVAEPSTHVERAEVSSNDDEGDDPVPSTTTAPPVSKEGPPRRRFLDEIHRELAAARSTEYSHKNSIDESSGTFFVDCSGIVDYALSRAAPEALASLPKPPKRVRPKAEDFVKGFTSPAPPWKRIARVAELEPGDVVAWLRPPDSKSKSTGHVMVVDGPVSDRGGGEWVVPIIDSTIEGHGSPDHRAEGKMTGLGKGVIVLVVDSGGAPTAFRWAVHAPHIHSTPVALGRISP